MQQTLQMGESKTGTIRVLLVDDHEILLVGVRSLLMRHPGIEVVGGSANGEQAVEQARLLHPDVVVMDLNLPIRSGIEAMRQILAESPGTRVLVLSAYVDREHVIGAFRAGAISYLIKDAASEELCSAIRATAGGAGYISPPIARVLLREWARDSSGLTFAERENQIMQLMAAGKTVEEIAQTLGISQETVESARALILKHLMVAQTGLH